MYTISGGRRLYRIEAGKYKMIKRDHVFNSETITVLIKPMRVKRYTKNIYIEKELTFNQGSGDYKLSNSMPMMEKAYMYLLASTLISMLIAYIITMLNDSGMLNIPLNLIMLFVGLWVFLTITLVIYKQYFKSNYEQYARKLNDCILVKSE